MTANAESSNSFATSNSFFPAFIAYIIYFFLSIKLLVLCHEKEKIQTINVYIQVGNFGNGYRTCYLSANLNCKRLQET